jgi:hypothetical protein
MKEDTVLQTGIKTKNFRTAVREINNTEVTEGNKASLRGNQHDISY